MVWNCLLRKIGQKTLISAQDNKLLCLGHFREPPWLASEMCKPRRKKSQIQWHRSFCCFSMSQSLSFGTFSARIGLFPVSIAGESSYLISAALSSKKDRDLKTITLIKSWYVSPTFCHPTIHCFSFLQANVVRASSTCRNAAPASGL